MSQSPSLALHTLSNGLRVYTMEVHRAPVVNFMVWYDVGSRNEGPGTTGISHFLEHMMFKGTEAFPNGTIEDGVRDKGGRWNAFTSFDYTAYYETMPSRHMELAVRIEADRMEKMYFDRDLTVKERGIIVSEREGAENRPTMWLFEALMSTAFQKFPYGHMVLGSKDDIRGMTAEALTAHYRQYYRPNNASIVTVGDFKTADMLRLIEEQFGPIPAGAPVVDVAVAEPAQTEERRVVVRRPAPAPYLYVAWKIPAAADEDLMALDVLASILAGAPSRGMGSGVSLGRSSRLYRRMVEGGLTADASAGTFDTKHPGLMLASFTIKPTVDPARVEEALYGEIETIQTAPVPPEEFERAIKQMRAQYTYSLESVMALSYNIGTDVIKTGTPEGWINYLQRLEAVSPEDVMRVARRYLTPSARTVATLLPESATAAPVPAAPGAPAGAEPEEGTTPAFQKRTDHAVPAVQVEPLPDEGRILLDPKRVTTRELPGGLKLLVYPAEGLRSATVRLSLEAGAISDPQGKGGLAQLTSQLLTFGTQNYTAEQLARKTDSLGMSLSVDSGQETVLGHVHCLPEDLGTGIELLAEVLRRPSFPQEEVARTRDRMLVRAREAANNTQAVAARRLRELLYPEGHPYRQSVNGDEQSIPSLTREDLISHHRARFHPGGALAVVVGDVEPDRVAEEFAARFGDWRGQAEPPSIPTAGARGADREHVVVPGKSQADIAMGWAVVDRTHPDYLPLELLAIVLGRTATGAAIGRLFRDVREKHGLSYYQYCLFNAGRGPAGWSIHIGVNPARLDFALEVLTGEVRKLREELIAQSELAPLLAFIEGNQALRLESGEAVAGFLQEMARYNLGFDYLQRYPGLLAAITPEQLRATAQHYLSPESLAIATAGPELK